MLVAVGRHELQKGIERIVAAMPLIRASRPNATLLVAGRFGSETTNLEQRITASNLSDCVQALGHRSDVPDLLAACDVMVFPSQWEGLGGAVVEAVMVGCPVVCSDLPVLREVASAARACDLVRFVESADAGAVAAGVLRSLVEAPTGVRSSDHLADLAPFLIASVAEQYAELVGQVGAPNGCIAGRYRDGSP